MVVKIKRAYTLIELLVCLIIIALIIAAFAPIMTKRLSNNNMSILGIAPNTGVHDLFLPYDDIVKNKKGDKYECKEKEVNKVKSLECTIKNIDATKINVLIVGAGGGGAGGSKYGIGGKIYDENELGTKYDYNNWTYKKEITPRMTDLVIHFFSVGFPGEQARYAKEFMDDKLYIETCPTGSSEETLASNGYKYCITEYNIRPKKLTQYENYSSFGIISDNDIVVIPDALKKEEPFAVNITLNQEASEGIAKCRITPEETCSNKNITDYPGCGRTVCNKQAANIMCKELTLGDNNCKDESGKQMNCKGKWRLLEDDIKYTNGCNPTSSANAAYCKPIGRDGINYYPSEIWRLNSNSSNFQSVRCALLKSTANTKYKIAPGRGGIKGIYYKYEPKSIIEANCLNQKCCIEAKNSYISQQYGMSAGEKKATLENIAHIDFKISNENNQTIYNYSNSFFCYTKKDNCYIPQGGANIRYLTKFTIMEGGKGEEGYLLNNKIYGSGGDGGSVMDENITETLNDYEIVTTPELQGKQGDPGYIVLEYVSLYKGASGGGGGGAGYAMVKDIEVSPNQEYEIEIGGGGKGGIENEDGIDGGDTVVKFGSSVYIAHGGKGGKIGKSEDDVSDERIAGIGGEGGKIEGVSASAGIGGSQEGQRGTDGTIDGDYIATGGLGGRSGISMSTNIVYAACGGLYFDNNISCLNQDNHNGLGAEYLNPMEKKPEHIYKESSLGSYGAGGGGGGWKYVEYTGADSAYGVFAGKGGDGQGGYVYIWW